MSMREDQEPTTDEHGAEVHPAFGMVQINRVSSSSGVSLFDSEIQHTHFIQMRISGATRGRDLNRDWIHDDATPLVKIEMSEAQWASMISSLNTSGTPCTLTYTKEAGHIPSIPFAPRLELSMDETKNVAEKMFDRAREALTVYKEHKTVGNLRNLESALNNAGPNVKYAGDSLTKHVENVVQKAKADVEAMMDSRARQLGVDPHEKLTIGRERKDLTELTP